MLGQLSLHWIMGANSSHTSMFRRGHNPLNQHWIAFSSVTPCTFSSENSLVGRGYQLIRNKITATRLTTGRDQGPWYIANRDRGNCPTIFLINYVIIFSDSAESWKLSQKKSRQMMVPGRGPGAIALSRLAALIAKFLSCWST